MATEAPWAGDTVSLVDAFRRGERSPTDELESVLAAIADSDLNAFCHVDEEGARRQAGRADTSLPLGGVPIAVKQLDPVAGWPLTEASLVFADRLSSYDGTVVERLRRAGAVLVGQTTASEFGGLNVGTSLLNGTTSNPWDRTRTPGGSSAGSAAAVAGGIVTLATGGEGGGSIRIPAGFCGLPGMKGTAGRIPRGPHTIIGPLTVVLGCLARSVRDIARYYDVTAGFDRRDPYSLPSPGGWEAALGSVDLRGLRAAVVPDLGAAVVRPEVSALVEEAARQLASEAGIEVVDVPVKARGVSLEWAMANLATLVEELGDLYPDCADRLTPQIAFGLQIASQVYDLRMAARVEAGRRDANEAMAAVFDEVDLVFCATNPDVAFGAEVMLNTRVGDVEVGPENNGALTIPANIAGNPAVSIPAGSVDGLPVGLQVIGRHHADAVLLDLALLAERVRPWPLTAPGAPL
ncbi:MAG TPA: amidase [Acidimicrobiales bacterium]|nr:amidase [Acidimicrobiales bacterium]